MKKIIILLIVLLSLFLLSCGKEYHIEYNLDGGYLESAINTFKNPEDLELPIPTKEGYFFIGWQDGEKFIEKLEKKDYSLKAFWVESIDYEFIDDVKIFEQNELDYYVYLMRDGCSWCEKIKDDVIRYQYKTSIYNNIKKIYIINLQNSSRSSIILRTYGEESDDNDGFFVDGVEKWNDLYIPSTPTLIEIKDVEGKRTSELIASGATIIKNKLYSSLIDENDYSKTIDIFKITYDLDGGTCDELIDTFNQWTTIYLPVPQKEGYNFSGWANNGEYIKEIDMQDYNLVANWVEIEDIETLEENDIFSKDGSYYIYFLKEQDDNQRMLEVISKYNALSKNYGVPPIYIVDLEQCKVIYRVYNSEENTYFVDGAKSIDEMYVSRKKSLIIIDNKEAKFIGDTYKSIAEYLENIIKFDLSE